MGEEQKHYAELEPHTPEPWKISASEVFFRGETHECIDGIDGADGSRVVSFIDVPGDEADDRRIVACINACAGLHTEALETGRLEMLFSLLELAANTPLEQEGSVGRLVLCITSMREHLAALKTIPKSPKKPRVLRPDDELALQIP